jgi:hypothetical protein
MSLLCVIDVSRSKGALYAQTTREFWGRTEISCMSAVHIVCKR